jgi:hypothetical protein
VKVLTSKEEPIYYYVYFLLFYFRFLLGLNFICCFDICVSLRVKLQIYFQVPAIFCASGLLLKLLPDPVMHAV